MYLNVVKVTMDTKPLPLNKIHFLEGSLHCPLNWDVLRNTVYLEDTAPLPQALLYLTLTSHPVSPASGFSLQGAPGPQKQELGNYS